jgi:myo-inositol-1(or 4)-monophosphatase
MGGAGRGLLTWVEREVARCRPLALRRFRSRALRVRAKADGSPVTAADRAVEARLRLALRRAFPGEAVVGEEFGSPQHPGPAYWTIDPIDGTRAFSRGLPTWSILVGRVERGRPVLGVCDFPALDVTVGVAPGVAAYLRQGGRRRKLGHARSSAPVARAVVFHGGLRWWPAWRVPGLVRIARECFFEQVYGDCYAYVLALQGHADAVVDYGVKPWDMVPLAALAQATGRVLTDFAGRPCHTGPESIFGPPGLVRRIARTLHNA